MYEAYRAELKVQKKSIRGLADYLGESEYAVRKKMQGVNPWRLWEAYGAMEYIEKPLHEITKYFPEGMIEKCC